MAGGGAKDGLCENEREVLGTLVGRCGKERKSKRRGKVKRTEKERKR